MKLFKLAAIGIPVMALSSCVLQSVPHSQGLRYWPCDHELSPSIREMLNAHIVQKKYERVPLGLVLRDLCGASVICVDSAWNQEISLNLTNCTVREVIEQAAPRLSACADPLGELVVLGTNEDVRRGNALASALKTVVKTWPKTATGLCGGATNIGVWVSLLDMDPQTEHGIARVSVNGISNGVTMVETKVSISDPRGEVPPIDFNNLPSASALWGLLMLTKTRVQVSDLRIVIMPSEGADGSSQRAPRCLR